MLVTLTRYDVEEARRTEFSTDQRRWEKLERADGFVWRGGGWSEDDTATVISLWQDLKAFKKFKEASGASTRKRPYSRVRTTPWKLVNEIPGRAPMLRLALVRGRFMSVLRCQVKENNVRHFVSQQNDVWTPGLSVADGMLGGVFASGQGNWFLVFSMWRDQAAYSAAEEHVFPDLASRSGARGDVLAVRRYTAAVETSWVQIRWNEIELQRHQQLT